MGVTQTVSLVVAVTANANSLITNTVVAAANEMDFTPASAAISTTVLPVADLALSKVDSPDPVNVGDRLTYTLTLTNVGPSTASGVILTDTLPAGVTLATADGGCVGSTTLVCTIGSMAAGTTINRSIVVTVTASAAGVITNSANVAGNEFDPSLNNNAAVASTTVVPVVGLALSQIDVPDPVYVGGRLTYTLTLTNHGPSNASGVVVTDTLPTGVVLADAGGCTGTTTLICSIGALNNGASATVSIAVTVTVNANAVITNTAVATANELALAPATTNASTNVLAVADLALTKSASPITGTAGLPLTYTLVVQNFGPSTATGVVLTDTLPATVQFVSATGATCNGTTTVVCNLGSLLASDVLTVTITVLPKTSGTVSNSAQVASAVYDPNLANNTTSPVVTPVKARLFLPLVRR